MVADIVTCLTSICSAVGDFLTPSAGEGNSALLTGAAVSSIAALFAVPVAIAAGRKAISLVKSIKG